MAAFEPIGSGIKYIDDVLDCIRLGDNVVWQVTSIEEFSFFAEPFVRSCVAEGRSVVYIRFARHRALLQDLTGVVVREFDPDEGFESFTVKIHEEITRQGRETIYVFDCLSELQSVWYTDLMMGNFFRVTCPYLFELDTVAYFPILRGRHSYDALSVIRDTTQLLLDVSSDEESIYLHPMKVWNRNSRRMFLPHAYNRKAAQFEAVDNGVSMSRYDRTRSKLREKSADQNIDSYDRFFALAKLAHASGFFSQEMEDMIIASTMTKDARLKSLVKQYYSPEDYFALRSRMIGSGAIGGKACGMLLARKIAEREVEGFSLYDEPHDSFYIGSDVFYTYIVSNQSWQLRLRQRSEEEFFTAADELKERLLSGSFPERIREQLRSMLEYYGQSPIIVRSSSFQEDGFGNAFAGKYVSIFCVNQGSPEQRLEALEDAVRKVYASTMDPSALEYRRRRGLDRSDEQMAILVQRVSGSYFGDYYFPAVAGVGYSRSIYRMFSDMDPAAGLLRLVVGLGTRAVDRIAEDYPRLSNLDRPSVTMHSSSAQKHRYSQRCVDVLDCRSNELKTVQLRELIGHIPQWMQNLILERDTETEAQLREMGLREEIKFISCQKLLETKRFTELMRRLLKTLEAIYQNPVDIEYAINLDKEGNFAINLLQCRPLYLGKNAQIGEDKNLSFEKTFFDLEDSSMGASGVRSVDAVVRIDPVAYYLYPYAQKYDVVTAINAINRYYDGRGMRVMLLSPGRIGTSSPELGVPVSFRDIAGFSEICEVSESRAGYMPELSYGSHLFQDLVEAEIRYHAIYRNNKTLVYDEACFTSLPNLFVEICPELSRLEEMISVTEPQGLFCVLDGEKNHAVCGFKRE